MSARWITADVFDGLATLEDGSVDLVVTSPPFLALRSYLPADHPDKSKEIGSEATPAEFIDTMLAVTAELRRVLAPHGSICVELGDTYAGSGGENHLYERPLNKPNGLGGKAGFGSLAAPRRESSGWPLAKSRTLIPQLYETALAYGINPLTGQPSPAGQWRIRNVVTWARPNPPVGALGDKWRPATSDVVVACTSSKRYWDDLATRKAASPNTHARSATPRHDLPSQQRDGNWSTLAQINSDPAAGAPLLDYWVIPPGGYNGQVSYEWQRPVDRHESVGDIQRTTSADCPEHGDHAGLPPTESHDAPQSEALSPHSLDTDGRPVQGQLTDFASNGETPDHSDSSPSPTTEMSDPEYAPVAKPRSKASSRTDPAPGTTPPDTPSSETTHHTADTPTSRESAGHRPDTSGSSTSEDDSTGTPASQTPDHIADTQTGEVSSEACTCSYYVVETKYTSHYAVFPPELVVPLVKAMCPEKVCRVCGEPSRRIRHYDGALSESHADFAAYLKERRVSAGLTSDDLNAHFGYSEIAKNWERLDDGRRFPNPEDYEELKRLLDMDGRFDALERSWKQPAVTEAYAANLRTGEGSMYAAKDIEPKARHGARPMTTRTAEPISLGWTDCGHDDYRPGIVLDCFAGSGTTLAVATGHGHDAIGIDLDPRNEELARERIGPFFFEVLA